MTIRRLDACDMPALAVLHAMYKAEIGEQEPGKADIECLAGAISEGRIMFWGAFCDGRLVGCCSVCIVYSTFNYASAGVFEDFFVHPGYRRRGIGRALANHAYSESGVRSMTVGCADCDAEMYRSLGFNVPLGNMLARTE